LRCVDIGAGGHVGDAIGVEQSYEQTRLSKMHAAATVEYKMGDLSELVRFQNVIKTFNHAWFSLKRDPALAAIAMSVCLGIRVAASDVEKFSN
jgi:hypothetical protein